MNLNREEKGYGISSERDNPKLPPPPTREPQDHVIHPPIVKTKDEMKKK